MTLLSQYVAGITPLTPGFESFQVRPQMGPLHRVTATIDSIAGKIDLAIDRTDEKLDLELVVPAGTTALVCLPNATMSNAIRINSVEVWPTPKLLVQGIEYEGMFKDYLHFRVVSGTWKFEATGIFSG